MVIGLRAPITIFFDSEANPIIFTNYGSGDLPVDFILLGCLQVITQ
jgi:hypothetical protein